MTTNDFYLTNTTLLIAPTFDSSITNDANASAITNGINSAIQALEQLIADPVCVKILFMETSSGLGASLTPLTNIAYAQYRMDFSSKYSHYFRSNPVNQANFGLALSNMPAGPNTGINSNTQVWTTAAHLASIGETNLAAMLINGNGGLDSTISLNMSILNLSRPGQNPGNYDLQDTVLHEVDEVLAIGGNGSLLYLTGNMPGKRVQLMASGPSISSDLAPLA